MAPATPFPIQLINTFTSPVTDTPAVQVGIVAVFLFILLDIIFGLVNAIQHKEFSSTKMRQGIGHKCAELGFLLVGLIIDGAIVGGFDVGFSAPVLMTICVYICLMEIGSLMETFADMNPRLADSPLFKLLDSVVNHDHEDDATDIEITD